MEHYLLAIDQGTTNSRAIIFNRFGNLISQHEIVLKQYYPQAGWVEQDPEEIFNNTVICCRQALKKSQLTTDRLAAVGITNQRETIIIWDKSTSKPVYPAIVWQDRRTNDICKMLSQTPLREKIYQKTGLLLDPYFSATKIIWLLNSIPGLRERAERGELLCGTIDVYLLWQLTKGKVHATDATNASRTLLFNIHNQQWDQEILDELNIPAILLPTVFDNTADFGQLDPSILGKNIPITAMAGDQQAATVGQACFQPGMIKATYGTGAFMLLNTGTQIIQSNNRLLSTVAYRLNKKVIYGLEGSIFAAGMTIKWLRDSLKLIQTAAETEAIAKNISTNDNIYVVPAFTGLGAPYWRPEARAAILGLTFNSNSQHIIRASLESVAYQSRDLLEAMIADCQMTIKTIRVDGGMVANGWLLQFLSDMLNIEVHRSTYIETTALGIAFLAGLQIGLYQSLSEISDLWQMQSKFSPTMNVVERALLYRGWKKAVDQVIQ